MVKDILKNIDQKTEEQIKKIEKDKEAAILDLEKKYQKEINKAKDDKLKDFQKETDEKVKEFLQLKKTESDFAVLKEKNKIIGEVYKKAEKKIAGLPEKEFSEAIASFMPENINGEIKAGRKTAAILKKRLCNEIADGLAEEGFIVTNNEVEMDLRISEILRQLRGKQEPEIIKILF